MVYFPGSVSGKIESHRIRTSYIQRLPWGKDKFRRWLPAFPNAIRQFDLRGYDCVLTFSHCVAKGVRVPAGVPHICYCHTPMRYAWHMRSDYLRKLGCLQRPAAALVLDYLRSWDRRKSSGVSHFIAVSRNVQERIKDAYGRESVLIHPPVDCERFGLSEANDGFYLIVSALVPYKRVDLAIETFKGFDRELLVVGNGPELDLLKGVAPGNVSFVDDADDGEVVEYMQKCRALIFPGEEDFGIVPLEAQSCGKPVIAFGKGGALETVVGVERNNEADTSATGMFFNEHSPQALRRTILQFEERESQFDCRACRSNALRFDRPIFQRSMRDYIRSVLDEYACRSEGQA